MMGRSFFSKLTLTYISIMIAVIIVFSYFSTLLYERNVFEDKRENLLLSANRVQDLTEAYYQGTLSKQELDEHLNTIGAITESKIYVVKLSKNDQEQPQKLQLEGLKENSILKDLEEILDNKTVFRKRTYFKGLDTYVVILGQPLFIQSKIDGVILFISPVSKLGSKISSIRMLVFLLAAIMTIIAMLIIYLNSKRISKPIRDLEAAAMKLAMGEYPDDINIDTNDEIGSLAKTFNYMKNRVIETDHMRRSFIANISHDLKTPLTTINGFIQGMLDGLIKPEKSRKYLEIINKETLRLMRLTGDILELAKIDSGNIKLYREYVKISEVIDNVCVSIEPLVRDKSISLSVACPQDINMYVDEDRIKQILYNIITDAIKYTNSGGHVDIIVKLPDEMNRVRLTVKDTEIGICEEELSFVFEDFYRVDKSGQQENSGTGLGLSIAKKLVELHGGKIYARSELNKGTEMIIEIPQ